MKLYDTTRLPNPRRVRIFLAEKNIEGVELEEFDPSSGRNDELWFRRKNPIGAVPVLELDDGTCIAETDAICLYFEDLRPEPPLMGIDPYDRAVVRTWQRRVEWRFFRFACQACICLASDADPVNNVTRSYRLPQWGEVCRATAQDYLDFLDHELGERPYIAGPRFTIADITVLTALDFAGYRDIRILPTHRHLLRWYQAVASRPSARA